MSGRLDGHHALVTGGTGIGAAIATALAADGAAVTVAGRRRAPLDELCRARGPEPSWPTSRASRTAPG